jgi:hypothetical protein
MPKHRIVELLKSASTWCEDNYLATLIAAGAFSLFAGLLTALSLKFTLHYSPDYSNTIAVHPVLLYVLIVFHGLGVILLAFSGLQYLLHRTIDRYL